MLDIGINETEYILLLSMYYRNLDEEVPELIKRYAKVHGVFLNGKWQMFSDAHKDNLVIKGYLVKNGERFELSDKFLDLFVTELVAGNELIDNYPAFATINGIRIPLKTSNRSELRKLYWSLIGGLRSEHDEVRQDVRYGKKEGLLNMSINNFIQSESWRDLRQMRKEDAVNNIELEDF